MKRKKSRAERTVHITNKSTTDPRIEAFGLLTIEHFYSNPQSFDFRFQQASLITRGVATGMGLIDQVRLSICSLRSLPGTHALEIADLIKAFALVHKDEIACVIQGVRGALVRHDRLAEGVAIGAFEALNTIGIDPKAATDAATMFMGYVFSGEFWTGKECIVSKGAVTGRLSDALLGFFGPYLWVDGEFQRYRLANVAPFAKYARSEKTEVVDMADDRLHDHLINEIYARLFLSAPPAYRGSILQKGIDEAVKGREALFGQQAAGRAAA